MSLDTLCRRCRQPIRAGELCVLVGQDGYAHAFGCHRPGTLLPNGGYYPTCPRCVEPAVIVKRLAVGVFNRCTACGWERVTKQ